MRKFGLSRIYSVKSLTRKLALGSQLNQDLFWALWKSKSPKRVNILIWIMLNGYLNSSDILQKKMPFANLMPSVCISCYKEGDYLYHIFFGCEYSRKCWFKLFFIFNVNWVFVLKQYEEFCSSSYLGQCN